MIDMMFFPEAVGGGWVPVCDCVWTVCQCGMYDRVIDRWFSRGFWGIIWFKGD